MWWKIFLAAIILVTLNYFAIRSLKKQIIRDFGEKAWKQPYKYITVITVFRVLIPLTATLTVVILYLLGIINVR